MQTAARNNAEWCDLVCRSHGLSTRWDRAVWLSPRRSPPLYPDAVTLSATATAEEVLCGIDISAGCSIKDSFACLDLVPAGFRILFEASWIRREPRSVALGPQWRAVRTADELRLWAATHGGGEVFRPQLLDHPMVTVLAAYAGETVVGGAIANLGNNVVGISNVFGGEGAADAVAAFHPGRPIVGYESGAELDIALSAGFVESGPLRVWLYN